MNAPTAFGTTPTKLTTHTKLNILFFVFIVPS
jgi:hypothetical protein